MDYIYLCWQGYKLELKNFKDLFVNFLNDIILRFVNLFNVLT